MNETEYNKIKELILEAKHSFVLVSSLTNDTKVALILAKWPDVTDSILDYVQDGGSMGFNRIVSDIAPIIYQPLAAIAEAYLEVLKQKGSYNKTQRKELDKIMAVTFKNPVDVKTSLIKFINKLVPLLNSVGLKLDPLKGMRHVDTTVC